MKQSLTVKTVLRSAFCTLHLIERSEIMKTAVIDDDIFIYNQVKELIASFFVSEERMQANEPLYFADGIEFLEYMEKGEKADIIFLDIEMAQSNGIDIAKRCREIMPDIIIIFVSSHRECVFDTFRCEALHFIVKPIDKDDFNEAFRRAVHKYNSANCFLPLKWQHERANVSIQDILYVESYRGHLIIHTLKEPFEVVGNLKDIFTFLEPHGFMRIHHGYIVNMQHIRRFNSDSILLVNGENVQMSIRKRNEALITYDSFLQKWKW